MISIRTAQNWGGGKSYGFVTAEHLDDLKKLLVDSDHKFVHLVQKDPWDNCLDSVKSDIPVSDLSDADIEWLEASQDSMYSCQRYLVCNL